jgi:MFS transporter, DHA1 family, tetracycline resistance protein
MSKVARSSCADIRWACARQGLPAGLFGPGLFTQAFARSIAPGEGWHLPGAPFLLAASMLVAAAALSWWVTRGARTA